MRPYSALVSLNQRRLPENETVDFELRLDHAGRPQPYSQDVRLRGHVIWRRDAGQVLKETVQPGKRGGGSRGRKT